MIGQYLSNNNEKSYSVVLQKILELNQPQLLQITVAMTRSYCSRGTASSSAKQSSHQKQLLAFGPHTFSLNPSL
jgi:hypothetical protein